MPLPDSFLPRDPEALRQKLNTLSSQDPRAGLQLKLETRKRLIETIEARLVSHPDDPHQLFILQEHLQARDQLVAQLRQLQSELDSDYQNLDAWVRDYVQNMQRQTTLKQENRSPDAQAELAALQSEKQTWEGLIEKVRLRLQKRPGDPLLMKLLAEHQGRLLKLQLQLETLGASNMPLPLATEPAEAEAPLLIESVLAAQPPEAGPDDPQRLALLRERDVLLAMVDKTRQRLAAKPELIQLKALIAQHEARIAVLQAELDGLA